jgi:hypothetical protein
MKTRVYEGKALKFVCIECGEEFDSRDECKHICNEWSLDNLWQFFTDEPIGRFIAGALVVLCLGVGCPI